jgi:hypothetical protein
MWCSIWGNLSEDVCYNEARKVTQKTTVNKNGWNKVNNGRNSHGKYCLKFMNMPVLKMLLVINSIEDCFRPIRDPLRVW